MSANQRRRRNPKASGKAQELKGRAKETLGRATGDPYLEAEGAADRQKGSFKQAWGKLKDAFRR
jgi:uncharacterized protein YjbJ (UPF0337 family)